MPMTANKVFVCWCLLGTLLSGSAFSGTTSFPEDSCCCGNEIKCIKKFSQYVSREEDKLYLRLKNGSRIPIESDTKCDRYETCTIFEFRDYLTDKGYYLLTVEFYEGSQVMMVSDETGKRHYVHAYPSLSPDRSRFVTISATEAYNKNGVFIWRFDADGLQPELLYEPKDYALYGFGGWRDNATISLTKFTHSDKSLCPETVFMHVPVILKLNKNKWEFAEDLRKGAVVCAHN